MNRSMPSDSSSSTDAHSLREQLDELAAITNKDLAAYAAARGLTVAQVRNAYYRALANVLRVEIQVNPATEEKYKNIQMILSLFLNEEPNAESRRSRSTIRSQMTGRYAETIAVNYEIPVDFVEYVIMNDDWDDDDWTNDDDWKNNLRSRRDSIADNCHGLLGELGAYDPLQKGFRHHR